MSKRNPFRYLGVPDKAVAAICVRFAKYFTPGKTSECWLWKGSKTHGGYGQFKVCGAGGKQTSLKAHRISWMLTNGHIPAGLFVMHKCDVPACINPSHLSLGTCADNLHDMSVKGRACRGERSHLAKLTEREVLAIRADARFPARIAPEYGVSKSLIRQIKIRRCWRHI